MPTGYLREPSGPVVPIAVNSRTPASHKHSEAVMFDFVQPTGPSGRLCGWARQAGLAEVGKAYAAQQHGPDK
jgi:hypothetical protein